MLFAFSANKLIYRHWIIILCYFVSLDNRVVFGGYFFVKNGGLDKSSPYTTKEARPDSINK